MNTRILPICELSSFDLAVFDQDDTLYSHELGLKPIILEHCLLSEAIEQDVPYDPDDIGNTLFRLDDKGQDEMTRRFREGLFCMDRIAMRYERLDLSKLKPCEESINLLSKIPLKRIVCTDSPDIHAERVLNALKKSDLFEEVCTGTSRGFMFKPFEGVYTGILERHNVKAKRVLFVEDSLDSAKAAFNLGMRTVLVGPHWQEKLNYVDYAYPDLLTFLKHCTVNGVYLADL